MNDPLDMFAHKKGQRIFIEFELTEDQTELRDSALKDFYGYETFIKGTKINRVLFSDQNLDDLVRDMVMLYIQSFSADLATLVESKLPHEVKK